LHHVKKGHILEVFPDRDARRAGDRWFMIVMVPTLINIDGKQHFELCRWCMKNSLEPCTIFRQPVPCEIKCVKAFGERTAPKFQKFAAAPTVAAPSTRVILDKIKSLSQQQEKQKEEDTHDQNCVCRKCMGFVDYKRT
jgi:hypothetical protein